MFPKNKLITKLAYNEYYCLNYLRKSIFDVISFDFTAKDVECYLYQKSILIKVDRDHENSLLTIKFDVFLFFQIEKNIVSDEHQDKSSRIVINLQKMQQKIQIVSKNSEKQADEWIQYLRLHLNQRGFHKIFKPLKKIGKGTYASIYLIENRETNERYAAKAFSKIGILSQNKQQQSLQKQISIMRQLKHKNIVKLFQVFQTEHSLYLIEQLFEGGRLSERMTNKRFSIFQIVLLFRSITEGLAFMHKRQIMHRDIKPENILFRREGQYQAVIADFGLAESTKAVNYLFVRCGTPGYVAPEIVSIQDRNTRYTTACDIFSLGVIFYQLLTQKSLFKGKDFNSLLNQNKACCFSLNELKQSKLPANALDLLKKMLQKDPNKRITANQILSHNFLKIQILVHQKVVKKTLIQSDRNHPNVPLGQTSPNSKFNRDSFRQQSLQKFKMKQNMSIGSSQQGEAVQYIFSPQQRKTRGSGIRPQSRFKRIAKIQ